jgi:hypothetical protein
MQVSMEPSAQRSNQGVRSNLASQPFAAVTSTAMADIDKVSRKDLDL